MDARELLSQILELNKSFLARYTAGLDDATRTSQSPTLPNHAAWCLGHLAFTMHRVAGQIDGGAIPAEHFIAGPAGRHDAFASDAVAFGSTPVADPSVYPAWARCVEIYNAACDRMARAVREASDEQMARAVPWGSGGATTSLWHLAGRMVFHNGFHTGQIADLRRALGLKSVFA